MLTRTPAGVRLASALSRQCRLNSTTSKPIASRSQVPPTTFSEKASPRNVHDRPEQIRGFPASSPPRWAKNDGAAPGGRPTLSREEAFDGPSKPRMMYARQSQRELPDFKVDTTLRSKGRR
jgi:cytochrome c oxidase assembly factor 1